MKNAIVFGSLLLPLVLCAQSDMTRLEDILEEGDSVSNYGDAFADFPFGEATLKKYLASIQYPNLAKEKDIEGTVWVTFLVDSIGNILEPKVARGTHPILDHAALEHVKKMPAWRTPPGEGRKGKVKYAIPIRFRLM